MTKQVLRPLTNESFPEYVTDDGAFRMEFDWGFGWTLYAVTPRNGRIKMGESMYRRKLADQFQLTVQSVDEAFPE